MRFTDEPPVRLRVPAHPRHLRLVRLVASSLAADVGFTVDELDEVRIIVDEIGAALLHDGAAAEVDFDLAARDSTLLVAASAPADPDRTLTLDALAQEMLRVLTDSLEISCEDGTNTITVTRATRPDDT